MSDVENDGEWKMKESRDGSVMKKMKEREMWEKIGYEEWD